GLWGPGGYAYDAMGNLTALTLGSARSAAFSYAGATPKLAAVTENDTTRSVSYDPAGNEGTVGADGFSYSSRNSLARTSREEFGYDGRGVRTITFLQASLAGLSITPAAVTGGNAATGTVALASSAASALPVTLISNAAAAVVPSQVVVPSGSMIATFTVTTRSTATDSDATITASGGGASQNAVLTVLAPVVAALQLT